MIRRLLLMAALALAACTSDPTDPVPDVERETYPLPATEDQALANFEAAYATLDAEGYLAECLDGGYVFVFDPNADIAPEAGWSREDEAIVTRRLFGGEPGHDIYLGTPLSPVESISVIAFERRAEWEDVTVADPDFPGTRKALFEITLVFHREGGHRMRVEGAQVFYVSDETVEVDGAFHTVWRVVGQRDFTEAAKANGEPSWGDVKLGWR